MQTKSNPSATPSRPSPAARRRAFPFLATLVASCLLTACDTIDIEALTSAKDSAEAKLLAAAQGAKDNVNNVAGAAGQSGSDGSGANPSMDSIGPDSAMRVYYQFLDDRGGVQFVERLSDVPETWRDRVGYVEMDRPQPLTPAAARATWKLSESRKVEIASPRYAANRSPNTSNGGKGKRRMDDFQSGEVLLYSATWCGYCTKARKHLDRAGVAYKILDVDNGAIARELKEKTGRGGVPVLDFEGEILRGYSASQYDKLIDAIQG